jgi:hypothetical protein
MGVAIVGAVAVLVGAGVAGLVQYSLHWAGRRDRRFEEVKAALLWVLDACAEHRGHQYLKIRARRDQLADTVEARRERYAARTAVTTGMNALTLATDDGELLDLARELVGYSFALGDAADQDVDTVGDEARAAHQALQDAAARYIHQHA